VQAPSGNPLKSPTPAFTIRSSGFESQLPLQVRFQISTRSDVGSDFVLDTTFTTSDSVRVVQVTRVLPSEAVIYWRAIVRGATGIDVPSAIGGPLNLPPWVTLIFPNSPAGDVLDVRTPQFVWRRAPIVPEAGDWRFDIQVTSPGGTGFTATVLNDTTFRPAVDLDANTSYQWSVRATTRDNVSATANSEATFSIVDPAVPTTTIFYQNFPNPFPTDRAFSTCFWFDIGARGADVSLEVLDIRGNLVRTIIPASDGVKNFLPGRYGRGPGLGNNCDNRFVWDGTGNDGRTVPNGTYLARFRANRDAPIWHKMIFLGR
jgi:hypothetical protein